MIGDPPLLTGAVHETVTELEVVHAIISVKLVGGSGTVEIVNKN